MKQRQPRHAAPEMLAPTAPVEQERELLREFQRIVNKRKRSKQKTNWKRGCNGNYAVIAYSMSTAYS